MTNKKIIPIEFIAVCLTTAIITYLSLSALEFAYASSYSAIATGYAFGSASASGNALQQYNFANHPSKTMCNKVLDASGDWPWGAQITMANPVVQRNWDNTLTSRRVFLLADNGDPSCSKGANWVDLYFGNYKQNATQNCTCSGVPNPRCVTGTNYVNNCTDAVNFGSKTRSYDLKSFK